MAIDRQHQNISKILKISKSDGRVVSGNFGISYGHNHKQQQRDNEDEQYTMFEYSRVLLTKGLRNYMLPESVIKRVRGGERG